MKMAYFNGWPLKIEEEAEEEEEEEHGFYLLT